MAKPFAQRIAQPIFDRLAHNKQNQLGSEYDVSGMFL